MRAKRLAPYLFVLPSLLGLLAFFYVPFLWSARFLFLGQDGGALASFQRTLQNEMFLSGSGNTLLFCLCCVPPLLLLSTGLATGLRYAQRSARGFLGLLFLPYVLPVSAVVAFFSYLFDYRGPVNRLLATLGGARVQWLDSGAIFGPVGEGFQRFNVACPRATLTQALEQLEQGIQQLHK